MGGGSLFWFEKEIILINSYIHPPYPDVDAHAKGPPYRTLNPNPYKPSTCPGSLLGGQAGRKILNSKKHPIGLVWGSGFKV